ncbi:hypothetical protein EXIGLDRAFT_634947 [Exidia glandulosa HHB12029]|uniref:Uncharacterized protein n=1 Tax=Exidia glandulosa HHB12029 TaxID=1314781 RepID=A0A165QJC2_EXIGL|nr:hypothetical protein EXIGLDRAFT_634947 [Exidia glandulosa HHB12029]
MVRITDETRARWESSGNRMANVERMLAAYNGVTEPLETAQKLVLRNHDDESVAKGVYKAMRASGSATWKFLQFDLPVPIQQFGNLAAGVPQLLRAMALKEDASALFARGDHPGAIAGYEKAMRTILGDDSISFPTQKFYFEPYLSVGERGPSSYETPPRFAPTHFLELLALASNILQSHIHLNQFVEAIDWLHEFRQILACVRLTTLPGPQPSWKDWCLPYSEYYLLRFKTWLRGIQVFNSLGNTAAAACFAQLCMVDYGTVDHDTLASFPRLHAVYKEMRPDQWFQHRHPEPNIFERHVAHPDLQVLGVWDRIQYAPGDKPPGRLDASTWIWRGTLYVAAGTTNRENPGPVGLQDMWALNLQTRKWRRLPDVPVTSLGRKRDEPNISGQMRVRDSRVYCFLGKPTIAVFDLVTEEWSIIGTSMQPGVRWPYHSNGDRLEAFATAILDHNLYVFGGDDAKTFLGTNIFMALDLNTMRWSHISGTTGLVTPLYGIELRTNPAMWAVPSERRLFVMYGAAKRSNAYMGSMEGGASTDFAYTDIWSFHVDNGQWTREKLRGNHPSWRTEMACTWSPALERAIVYGGYNSSAVTLDDSRDYGASDLPSMFRYSYFGDTLLFDPTTRIWKHVLVKGFPSYRALSSLVCDPDDGKVYIFGGYTNCEYVPANRGIIRVYSDLWQLKIDMPGGNWNPKDLERDIRSERNGPWRKCYTCANVGISWQKCGGTCGGKYYFCSKDCQRSGWKEHKETHGCRKKS